ncbi:MAG TPA: hypothetical protein VFG45_08925 [Candidatus Nitrosocosmicus sp.]|nr:hypothetical protein [Candidatus Nitrosocosmicus sp.]
MAAFNSKNHKSKLAIFLIALTLTVGFSYVHTPQKSYAIDDDVITETELEDKFHDAGISSINGVSSYIKYFEECDDICNDELERYIIDVFDPIGEEIFDIISDHVLGEV